MGWIVRTVQEIQRAIESLARGERLALVDWLAGAVGCESAPDRLEEARPEYAVSTVAHMTVEAYLALEQRSPLRHEYLNGALFAMSGASVAHNQVTRNLVLALSSRLRGGPCEVFFTDLKLRLELGADEVFYYPDVMVACDPAQWGSDFIRHPKLVAEVLSPSTRHIDQREKSLNYHQTASIEEYLILWQRERRVCVHRRADGWAPRLHGDGTAPLELQSLGVSVPLEEIYAGVHS